MLFQSRGLFPALPVHLLLLNLHGPGPVRPSALCSVKLARALQSVCKEDGSDMRGTWGLEGEGAPTMQRPREVVLCYSPQPDVCYSGLPLFFLKGISQRRARPFRLQSGRLTEQLVTISAASVFKGN